MGLYQYKGRNNLGKLVEGALDGVTVDAIAAQLVSRGITPIKIEESEEQDDILEKLKETFGQAQVELWSSSGQA